MATVIDPGAGALAQAISSIGDVVGEALFRERIREREIQRDPALSLSLGEFARAARDSGNEAAFAESIGVRPEFVTTLAQASFVTPGEQEREAAVGLNLGRQRVETEAGELQVRGRTAQERLRTGQPERTVAAEGAVAEATEAEAEVSRGVAERFMELGGPQLQAVAQAAGLEFDVKNAEFQSGLIDLRVSEGVDASILNAQKAQAILGAQGAQTYKQILDSLEPGSFEQTLFVSALAAPSMVSALASMRNADLNGQIRSALVGAQTEQDRIALTGELMTRFNESVDRLSEHEQNDADRDVIDQAKQDVNNMQRLIRTLQERGALVEGVDLVEAGGRRGRFEFTPLESRSPAANSAMAFIVEELNKEGANVDELRSTVEANLVDERFTVKDREQVLAEFESLVSEHAESQREPSRFTEQLAPSGLEDIGRILSALGHILSPVLSAPTQPEIATGLR